MRGKIKIFFQIASCLFLIIYFCEFLIYYLVIFQCTWPKLQEKQADSSFEVNTSTREIKALFVADIHLLGKKKGHWIDKLRREWQMYKAFHTAVSLLEPEVIFMLGDLFDEGLNCEDDEFQYYVNKLKSLFQVKNATTYFVAGNHDVGYHNDIDYDLHQRFVRALNVPSVQLISIRGNHFVLINSMAFEGDGCFLCKPAQIELNKIAKRLRCAKGFGRCSSNTTLYQYSRPILLQHFPMYRESDKDCFEPKEALEYEENEDFYEGWDCLSKEASEMIYDFLDPRVILSGHTHQGCHIIHRKDIHEFTVASFNWRYKNSPSFLVGTFLPNNFSIKKCPVPQESTVILFYCIGLFGMTCFIMISMKSLKTHLKHYGKFD